MRSGGLCPKCFFRMMKPEALMIRSLVSAASLLALAAPMAAQTPLERALAASADGPLYTFDLALKTDEDDARMKVNPSRPEGERLTVVSPSTDSWSEDFAKRVENMKANTDGGIWCQEFAENIPVDAELVSETKTTATYTFTPQPGAEPDGRMEKVYKFLTGTVVVDKHSPAILNFEMVASKPFKPAAVAKISQFEMKATCERAPDGRTHIASLDLDVSGSAMMQGFSQSDRQVISNLKAIPESGTGTK
jgi:hypothetical protein